MSAPERLGDLRILWHLLRGQASAGSHASRLEAFYAPQADRYDDFRERLLHGRRELLALLDLPPGGRLVELGCGTGRNLAFLDKRIERLSRIDLVDLCPSLLERARRRWAGHPAVHCHEADATRWQPGAPVDAVLFSYSLSMIPDWRAALDNALGMLRPGGELAVVDFTPDPRQGAVARAFWRSWFGHDGVRLDPEHARCLSRLTTPRLCSHRRGAVPWLPGLRAPYYLYIGSKPD